MTDDDIKRQVILKAAYEAERIAAATRLGGGRTRWVMEGKLQGIGVIAADVLHIGQSPWGFAQAVAAAYDEVGGLNVPGGSSRERAAEVRAEWETEMVKAVEGRLT